MKNTIKKCANTIYESFLYLILHFLNPNLLYVLQNYDKIIKSMTICFIT